MYKQSITLGLNMPNTKNPTEVAGHAAGISTKRVTERDVNSVTGTEEWGGGKAL